MKKVIIKLAAGMLAGCISGATVSFLAAAVGSTLAVGFVDKAQAQVNPISQLVQVVRFQTLHYRQFGSFTASTSAITNFVGQFGSHYLANNSNRSQVIVNAIPRNPNGVGYSVGVFVNPQNNRQLLAVVCQARQSGRNLPPQPGIGSRNGQAFAGCRTGSSVVAGPFQA